MEIFPFGSTRYITGAIASVSVLLPLPLQAQLLPDQSLGAEGSIVNFVNGDRQDIAGGALRGSNLFHSFQEFNVGQGQSVYFANPAIVENILTRVTGSNISEILGTLGVAGDANLFLINPNGIYFGKDARLDVSGSFTASTGEGIRLGDNDWFGMTTPPEQLLTIKPETSFNYALQNYTGDITNEGQLQAGKDLNLQAKNLFLSGQLSAQENLNLQATDTVQVRDTDANSFIAKSGGNSLIQGNQNVDIYALNHPDSGFFSGGDLVLRSSNTVGGDAHYWSGGNFKIEQLDGNLGDLFSPYDPVVRASGDVSFASYTGASLHIFAGGSVNVSGNINITGTDTAANSIIENVTLSNGNVISIDGSNQPTLDIRAGTTAFGTAGIAGSTSGFSSVPVTNGTGTSADITIGSITNNGGLVFLTNKYFPNTSLAQSVINIIEKIDTSDNSKDGGNTTIDGRSEINLNSLASYSFLGSGDGGAITILSDESIYYKEIDSSTEASNTFGHDGGTIILASKGNIYAGQTKSSSSQGTGTDDPGDGGNGGAITFSSGSSIFVNGGIDSTSFAYGHGGNGGNGGAITLITTNGNIEVNATLNSSLRTYLHDGGNGGAIVLTATNGNIVISADLDSGAYLDSGSYGNGGAITLSTTNGYISANDLLSQSLSYKSFVDLGNAGDGGSITLNTINGDIFVKNLYSESATFGDPATGLLAGNTRNGGAITLSSTNGNISTENINSFSYSPSGNVGNGGTITIDAQNGDILGIFAPGLNSFSVSGTEASGKGGNVILKAQNNITNLEILTPSSGFLSGKVQVTGFEDLALSNTNIITSKQLTINTPFGDVTINVGGSGQSGNVTITASGNLTFDNSSIQSDTKGTDPAGIVTINSPKLITFNDSYIKSDTSGLGQAGSINITADQGIILDSQSYLSAITSSRGNAGTITINTPKLTLDSQSQISTATSNQGKAGDVIINTPVLNVFNGSSIFALTEGSGDGGTILVNAPVAVNLGRGVQDFSPVLSVETSNTGKAGNIIINTPNLTVSDTARITATASVTATNLDGGGSININANNINLAGVVGVFAETQGQAPAGTLLLQPYQNNPNLNIDLFTGSKISASTSGSGNGGNLVVTAPNDINISGQGILAVETSGSGDAGMIEITSKNLTLKDGATISASTSGSGDGGYIKLTVANNLNIFDSLIEAATKKFSTGNGGDINIDPINTILNNSSIAVDSQGSGIGGDILINSNSLSLANNSTITTDTLSSDGGNISLQIGKILTLQDGSNISATAGRAQQNGNGGNISIVAPIIFSPNNQDNNIRAEAFSGIGGNIYIKSIVIAGLEFTGVDIPVRNDITVSSKLGVDGLFTLDKETTDVPTFPGPLVDAEDFVGKNACAIKDQKIAGGSSFVIKGKGGLPNSPTDNSITRTAMVDFIGNSTTNTQAISGTDAQQTFDSHDAELTIAQGWQKLADGTVQLVGRSQRDPLRGAPSPESIEPALQYPNCI